MDQHTCLADGCDRAPKARRLCRKHYQQYKRRGSELPPRKTPAARFWEKVLRTPSCWLWLGATDWDGYGIFQLSTATSIRAHRLAYQWATGPVPDGLQLDHRCRTRNCVNPDHLEPVTNAENNYRGQSPWARNKRKIVCDNGHLLTPANTYVYPSGSRSCRICRAAANRAYKLRKRRNMDEEAA